MERKKLNDKRSSSAPCVNERAGKVHASAERSERTGRVHASKANSTVRICFAVMTIVLLLSSMVIPSMALVYDAETIRVYTMLSGRCDLLLTDLPDDISGSQHVEFEIGGRMPWFSVTGANDTVDSFDMYTPFDETWNFYGSMKLARRKTVVDLNDIGSAQTTLDTYRYNINTYLEGSAVGDMTNAYYEIATYTFDPYYVPFVSTDVLQSLFELRLTSECRVTTDITYQWVDVYGELRTETRTGSDFIGNPNVEIAPGIIDYVAERIIADVAVQDSGAGMFIQKLTVTVMPMANNYKATGLSFDMLAEQWYSGTPTWYNANPVAKWLDMVENYIDVGNPYPDVDEGPFMTFIVDSVATFFDTEIMPGFSLGGVFSVVFMIVVIILILKFFAGG